MTYQRKDAHYRRARAAGYRARSAYKLAELDRRFGILRPGDIVVDLGAWPGGWLQVARERVGERGTVVGVDLVPIDPLGPSNVSVTRGDVRDPSEVGGIATQLGRPADVVLSDLAPNLTGIRDTDEARSEELVDAVLAALPVLLRPGGCLLIKLFMGPHYPAALAHLKDVFGEVRVTRPAATRPGSAELYAFGKHHRVGEP
jgi:23S rRNA (uridine2552-2'-O)-methyltransferase